MPRYIDADKARERAIENSTDEDRLKIFLPIEDCPTAEVVEVVRCKDCKNYLDFGSIKTCKEYGGELKPLDFCSRGARMDGE